MPLVRKLNKVVHLLETHSDLLTGVAVVLEDARAHGLTKTGTAETIKSAYKVTNKLEDVLQTIYDLSCLVSK